MSQSIMAFTAKTLLIILEYMFEVLINTALPDSLASIGKNIKQNYFRTSVYFLVSWSSR